MTGTLQHIQNQTQQTLTSVTSHHCEHTEEIITKATDIKTLIEESPSVQIYTPEESTVQMEQSGPLINP